MGTERQEADIQSTYNGPAPLYQSLVGLMQQNLELGRDMMRRSLDSMHRLAGLPSETIGRIEPFRAPATAWADINHRSIDVMQKFAEQRMDTLQQWTKVGLELMERSLPAQPPAPEIPQHNMVTPVPAEKPKRAA